MRSVLATILAVAFVAHASVANAQDVAATATLPGDCPWQGEGAAFDLADTLTDAKCAADRTQQVSPELVAIVAERAVYVGPREMGKPSGVERQVTFRWLPTGITDPDDPGAVVFAMNQYKPYRDLKDANHAWTTKVSAVGEALAPFVADQIVVIGPKWMKNGAAAGVKTGLDVVGQAAFAAPFAMMALPTAGVSLTPLTAMYAEALFMAPTGTAHGASEFVDGLREGNYERALEGAGEFCGNVGVVMLAAGGAASTAGKALPASRAPITLFEDGVPGPKPIPPEPISKPAPKPAPAATPMPIPVSSFRTPKKLTLSQKGLAHIVDRHWHTAVTKPKAPPAGKFNPKYSSRATLEAAFDAAAKNGEWSPARGNRLTLRYDPAEATGIDRYGVPARRIEMIVEANGDIVTAYPIP